MYYKKIPHAIAFIVLVTACTKGEGLRTVRDHEATWKKSKSSDYSYVFYADCECPQKAYSPARIEVRDNEINRIEDVFTGQPLRTEGETTLVQKTHPEYFYTIDGLFDLLTDSKRAAERQVEFHESFGYPTSLYIDYKSKVKDDELDFEVHGLVFE